MQELVQNCLILNLLFCDSFLMQRCLFLKNYVENINLKTNKLHDRLDVNEITCTLYVRI